MISLQCKVYTNSLHHGMKIYGLAQHEVSLALRMIRSCGRISAESYGTLPFVSQWLGVGFCVSIPYHIRPPIVEYKYLWKCYKSGKCPPWCPTLLTNVNGGNHLEQPAKKSGLDPRCHPPSGQKVEGLQKMLQLKYTTVWGWSKSTEAGRHKNQGLQHPQKWDPQGVDKYNVGLLTPCPESLPTNVHSRIYTLEMKLGGLTTTT